MSHHPLRQLINLRKTGTRAGIGSICSANQFVIAAAMKQIQPTQHFLLVEATANQVNQFGGYTNMKPADFVEFIKGIAHETGFPEERILLGGDHLGPLTWKNEPEALAMEKAEALIQLYVEAGFTKIHIDTSMHLKDDDTTKMLDPAVVARRGARLAVVAEKAYINLKNKAVNAMHPVYVIGSEVPVPGGVTEDEGLQVTKPEDFIHTVELFKEAFNHAGIGEAFEYVIAVVVQPGVEFGNDSIHGYNREAAKKLCECLISYPDLVFEGHSTDYQTRSALKEMVEDGIVILKVGPALTFAFREALFMLAMIEKELYALSPEKQSYFMEILDSVMLEKPDAWKPYYHGDEFAVRLSRRYGLSDRARYYLTHPRVVSAITQLLSNLDNKTIPIQLISQYLPIQYEKVRSEHLGTTARELLLDRIGSVIDDYLYATT